ncbi:MAG: hypothetical protein OEY56_06910 [Cyclobacteriaceae bacterium]|nr:hypothetical protein [Cyclobacteriaceae bacterium]
MEAGERPWLAFWHPGYPSSAVSFLSGPMAHANGKDAAAAGADKGSMRHIAASGYLLEG